MNEEEQKEQMQESFDEIEEETEEISEESEEAAVEPQPEAAVEAQPAEKSETGGELSKRFEQQPTQMFKAKTAESVSQKQSWKQKLKDYLFECRRVLKVTKKPNKQEFMTIFKVSGLGILVIGLIGFLINMARELLL